MKKNAFLSNNVIYKAAVIFIIIIIACLPFIKIPISLSSRGVVRPHQESSAIVSLVSGRVISMNVNLNNQLVRAGDTLVTITSENLNSKNNYQEQLQADYGAQLADLKNLVNGQHDGLLTGQYQTELSALQEKISEIQIQLSLAEKELKRNLQLLDQGIISSAEYDKSYHFHQQLIRQKSTVQNQQLAQWQAQKREIERQMYTVSNDIEQLRIESGNHIITAPIDGRITNYSGLRSGNFVVQGQQIALVAPEDELLSECMVPPASIGFIHVGQPVRYQMDTYNYNQWGFAEGEVIDIDHQIRTDDRTGEAYFIVRCSIKESFLALKNGYKGSILKGHTHTSRFYLTDRTLWQLLFDKADNWFNPHLL